MSEEEQKLLEETLELVKENNDMLRDMRRSMRFGRIMSILYWVFIIGSALGAYYLIQPYVEQLISIYGGAKSGIDNLNGAFQNFGQ